MQEFLDMLKKTRSHLMTGVSYMVPVVLAGAIPMALGIVIDTDMQSPVTQVLFEIGGVGMGLFVAVMAAYIAYAIGGRAAIAPGLICGMIATNKGTGFLGGIIIGLIVGYVIWAIRKVKLSRTLQPIMALIVYPLTGTLVGGLIMIYVIANPIAALMSGLTNWLAGMSEAGAVALGAVLGAMIGFDFGGPVNKVAYTFAVGLIGEGILGPMGMVGPAISAPAVGMGLAALFASKLYSQEEREAAKAAIVLGLVTVSEGAIPFAVVDPIRVMISCSIGGAVSGALAGLMGVTNMAPLGGVLILPGVGNRVGYVVALLAGSLVTAFLVNFLKRVGRKEEAVEEASAEAA